MMWAHMADVVVLPCVPATHRPLCERVSSPSTWARFSMQKPPSRKKRSSAWSAGMAGVYTTRQALLFLHTWGISSVFSS